MRTITDHKVNGLNEAITIEAAGEPGAGGANTTYALTLVGVDGRPVSGQLICFQSKPIAGPEDFNGLTNEALLAIVIDRMRGVQGMLPHQQRDPRDLVLRSDPAPFRCRENALALTHLEEALMWLQKRTRDRMARGVEGSHSP